MKLILDDLSFERGNLENTCRDVQVHCDMEQLSQREVKFYLSVYAGYISDDDFRYYLKIIYLMEFEEGLPKDRQEIVNDGIYYVVPQLSTLLLAFDSIIQEGS